MNLKEIKELITLMNENNLLELEIEREGMRIKLKRLPEGGFIQSIESVPAGYMQKAGAGAQPADAKPALEPARKLIEIKAPMVGTFYAAPSPESAPYIEVGSTIEVGQVLCIIEAMKLMNEIKSEVKGKIVERLVENAQPIEYGQVLFLVEPV
ncbi:MAG: acetyl-CoA carboxylase biotin carboxyl carrier protein [Candidatus Omnitrophica bacterium]|nr:acetyl-CoA carboxylase biotin carboxyl carrier protein [Candidatus Omnitrophota bacterium]